MNKTQTKTVIKVKKVKRVTRKLIAQVDINRRVIFECPEYVAGVEMDEPAEVNFERTVVTSDFFGSELPHGTILIQHKCWYRPVKTPVKALLSLAHVAGYRKLAYGLPEKNYPVLFEHPDNSNVLIAVTPVSNFIESRFAPKADWRIIIGRLQAWLQNTDGIIDVDWDMPVAPSYDADSELPNNIEEKALNRNIKWFNDYMFFDHGGRIGVFEGYISAIAPDGQQSPRPKTRGDCSGEATMVPAIDWAINKNYASRKMSGRIMDNLFNGPELVDNDPHSQTYGSLRYYEYVPSYYSESRAPIACILASELTGNYDYADKIMRNLLSLLRTTGPQGIRVYLLKNPESFSNGRTWKYYHDNDCLDCRPHYLACMWAAFLQAYVLTGHQEFLTKAKAGIRTAMDIFPDFQWQNGINSEYTRLLLPLAFLVQIEDIPEHRLWLRQTAEILLKNMHLCGAIQEKMGKPELGKYPAPQSNEEYATKEASLIQKNGDPVADLIYTVNYAFIGFHEAFHATGENFYKSASDKIADFLCRIQIKSSQHRYLDGAWMHGFDYELWEFFGSPSDYLWGPWCVESGWTNTWISAALGLRALKRPLLCHQNKDIYKQVMPELLHEMSVVYSGVNYKEERNKGISIDND